MSKNSFVVLTICFLITFFGINYYFWRYLPDANLPISSIDTLVLNNGVKIPLLGFGSGCLRADEAYSAIRFAIKESGYRHIDSAWIYRSEVEVGKAIKSLIDEGIVKREDLFITSKVWNNFHRRAKVIEGCRRSLANLGLSYFDLFLVHTPIGVREDKNDRLDNQDSGVDYLETWKGMEDCVAAGLTKSIGLSNFNTSQTTRILNECKIKPVVNQIESHPYFTQTNEIEFYRSNGILVTAYSPLGSGTEAPVGGSLLIDPILKEIAKRYNKSTAQIALRFQIQRNVVAIPCSFSASHIKQNIEIFDFNLSPTEMGLILSLNKNQRVFDFPEWKNHRFYPF